MATTTGVVHRVNKLVSIQPNLIDYMPETGDVVIGRIVGISDKKWVVDINARHNARLMISAINIPGGQRRRTDEDSLQMRSVLKENDLISAEVQRALGGGQNASLQTRSSRYGKLGYGQLVSVASYLVPHQRQHFHTLDDLNVEIIIGVNGNIFIMPQLSAESRAQKEASLNDMQLQEKEDGQGTKSNFASSEEVYTAFDQSQLAESTLETMARLRNAIIILDISKQIVTIENIMHVYNASIDCGLLASQLLSPDNFMVLAQGIQK